MEHCAARLRRHGAVYPGLLNPNYGPLLYAATRLLRPVVVVETGVGSGVSSTFFLSALEKNGKGRLHSIDLPIPRASLLPSEQQTGWLVPDELRPRWELTLGDARRHLPELLERLREIDFFYHDSDHRHAHMTWEYTTAYPHIRPDGLLLSDDVTSNRAWNDFTTPLAGTTTRINRTGIHRKPGTATTR
jgi:predicted O-methyltransferase YrrM